MKQLPSKYMIRYASPIPVCVETDYVNPEFLTSFKYISQLRFIMN